MRHLPTLIRDTWNMATVTRGTPCRTFLQWPRF